MATQSALNEYNGVNVSVLQETVDAMKRDAVLGKCVFRARNRWDGGTRNSTVLLDYHAARQEMVHKKSFKLFSDEPAMLAGTDEAPNPVENLLHALAGCVTTTIVAQAASRGIHIESLESYLEGDLDMRGFFALDPDVPKGFTEIRVRFRVVTDPKNLEALREMAEFSPVLNTITKGARVNVAVESA